MAEPLKRLAADICKQVQAAPDQAVPTLRVLRRAASSRVKPLEATDVIQLALLLLSAPSFPRWFAYEIVHHHKKALAALTEADLLRLADGLAGWADVDTFACYLAGPAWREGQITDDVIYLWAVSADRWWRRVAVVCTVALNNAARGGSGDASRTLAVCEVVKKDKDDMVVKALSWSLRELAKRQPEAARAFLRANEGQLAARVVREVRTKLETGLKNPRATRTRKRQ
jgi:3-methyladenine DNA glycosylase AlkD